jgi:hypothetical protein
MKKLGSDAHGRLELVVKDEEMTRGKSGTYTRGPKSLSTLRRPANGYLASHGISGVIKYTGTMSKFCSGLNLRSNLS